MNSEILERLIIDRDLQELSADTAALLEDYLRCKPEAAELAASVEATMRLAQSAVRPVAPPRGLPALRSSTLDRLPPISRGTRAGYVRWAMAAAIVLAFGLGGRFGATLSGRLVSGSSDTALAATNERKECKDFWSLARYRDRTGPNESGQHQFILWTSPVAWPRLGEKS